MFFFAVLAGVLLGLKAALAATLLNGVTLAVVGFLAFRALFQVMALTSPWREPSSVQRIS